MKNLLILFVSLFCFSALNGQTEGGCYMYGVDYSYAKVYAADESVHEFATAFEAINMLFIKEPAKYDFSRITGVMVQVEIEPMLKKLSGYNYQNLKSLNTNYTDADYPALIKSYELPQKEGTGMVLIAKILNKPMQRASYELITFDLATREILSQMEVEGKAMGFGLRNYWAGSIYHIIKNVRLY